jgi:myb proto-oncogene protein
MCPNTTEEQSYFMVNGNSSAQDSSADDVLWDDGLWNLDDVHGNLSVAKATNKTGLYNLIAPNYC